MCRASNHTAYTVSSYRSQKQMASAACFHHSARGGNLATEPLRVGAVRKGIYVVLAESPHTVQHRVRQVVLVEVPIPVLIAYKRPVVPVVKAQEVGRGYVRCGQYRLVVE